MKVPSALAALTAAAVCTFIAGCAEQTPSAPVEPSHAPGPADAIDKILHRRPSASDCFRNRIAEFRKLHGANAPIREDRVTEWQEHCQGT
ncbi:MAG TPA: hypothetical protein VGE12_11870 [Noviherbaspirillum sp.]